MVHHSQAHHDFLHVLNKWAMRLLPELPHDVNGSSRHEGRMSDGRIFVPVRVPSRSFENESRCVYGFDARVDRHICEWCRFKFIPVVLSSLSVIFDKFVHTSKLHLLLKEQGDRHRKGFHFAV